MKCCTRCGVSKGLELFGAHREGAQGRRPECKDCQCERERVRRQSNGDEIRAKDRVRCVGERERRNKTAAKWVKLNPDKRKEAAAKWAQANPGKHCAAQARRRAAKLRAIPPWADPEKTKAIYVQAAALRDLGIDVHVDHVIPLMGETVSGLHWHGNLELLLAFDNVSKGARLLPTVSPLAP